MSRRNKTTTKTKQDYLKDIEEYGRQYEAAKKKGDKASMDHFHMLANNARSLSGLRYNAKTGETYDPKESKAPFKPKALNTASQAKEIVKSASVSSRLAGGQNPVVPVAQNKKAAAERKNQKMQQAVISGAHQKATGQTVKAKKLETAPIRPGQGNTALAAKRLQTVSNPVKHRNSANIQKPGSSDNAPFWDDAFAQDGRNWINLTQKGDYLGAAANFAGTAINAGQSAYMNAANNIDSLLTGNGSAGWINNMDYSRYAEEVAKRRGQEQSWLDALGQKNAGVGLIARMGTEALTDPTELLAGGWMNDAAKAMNQGVNAAQYAKDLRNGTIAARNIVGLKPISNAAESTQDTVKAAGDVVPDAAHTANTVQAMQNPKPAIKRMVPDAAQAAENAADSLKPSVVEAATDAVEAVKQPAKTLNPEIRSLTSDPAAVLDGFGLGDDAAKVGQNIIAKSESIGKSPREICDIMVNQYDNAYEEAVKNAEEYVKSYHPQGVSVVKNADGTGYRASNNEQWYSDFYKKNGRAPGAKDRRKIAEELVKKDKTGSMFGWSESSQQKKDILDELSRRVFDRDGVSRIEQADDGTWRALYDQGAENGKMPYGKNTVGSAQSIDPPRQEVSKVSSNTFSNSGIFDDAEKQMLSIFDQDGDALYDVVTEKQSISRAKERLDVDYDGECADLLKKTDGFSGEDNDTAMGILSHELEKARQTGDYTEVAKWAKHIKDQGTQGGQLIQSFAKYSRTPSGIIVQGQREIDAALKFYKKTNPKAVTKLQNKGYLIWTPSDAQQVGDLMLKAQQVGVDTIQGRTFEAQAMAVIAKRMPPETAPKKVVSLLMDNMLCNFKTLVSRNAGGNLIFSAPEAVRENVIAAPIDWAVSKATGARTTYFDPVGKSAAWGSGLKKGATEMMSDIKNGVHTARSGDTASVFAQKKVFGDKGIGKIGNAYNDVTGSLLELGDRPFYEAAYASKMRDLERARTQGKLPAEFSGKNFDVYAPVVAKRAAEEAVFQNNGMVAQGFSGLKTAIGKISKGTTGSSFMEQASLPFTKTPGNLVERAIEYSPFGAVKNAAQTVGEIRSGTFNQQRFVNEASRNLIGSGLFALGGNLLDKGYITGSISDDKDEREMQKNAGMQDYSFHIGDKYVSYAWIPVIGPALAGAADFYQNLNGKDAENVMSAIADSAKAYVQSAMFEQSSLSSLKDMFSNQTSTADGIVNTAVGAASQAIPSIVRHAVYAADPYERQTYVSGDSVQSALNGMKASLPFLRGKLPIKVDEQGNDKLASQGRGTAYRIAENMLFPTRITQDARNAVRDELSRLNQTTGETKHFQNKVTYKVKNGNQERMLTPAESMSYQRTFGQFSTKEIQSVMRSSVYRTLSDSEKVDVISTINSLAKTLADKRFVSADLDSTQKKALDAEKVGISAGEYFAFAKRYSAIKNEAPNDADKTAWNIEHLVDLLEDTNWSESAKDYMFSAAGYAAKQNVYHVSEVEKNMHPSEYYNNLSETDKYIFRSYANEYEDVVKNGKSMDGWIAKAKAAEDHGVMTADQFALFEIAKEKCDTDKNGSMKQEEAAAAVRSMSHLTQQQKAYLFQSCNKKWKKNPFGSVTLYEIEQDEKEDDGLGKGERRIASVMKGFD